MTSEKNIQRRTMEKACITLINILLLLALGLVLLPHLMLAPYNYASGDDWSYGVKVYHALQNGGGLKEYVSSVWTTVTESYQTLESRWANSLFAALCPGNIREEYYHLSTWLFLAGLVISQLVFLPYALGISNSGKRYFRPIVCCMLILEILYVPYPTHSFYWWTGSVNYTFAFSLALLYCALLIGLATHSMSSGSRVVKSVVTTILAAPIAATCFVVNVPMLIVSFSAFALALCHATKHEKGKQRLGCIFSLIFPLLSFLISFCSILTSPALQAQSQLRTDGEASLGLVSAILQSLIISAKQLFINWMDIKVILFLLLAIPFAIVATRKSVHLFPLPALVTLFSFGLFASFISVELYINGEIRSTYGINVWYFAFYLFLLLNETYWIGWLVKRPWAENLADRLQEKHPAIPALLWCAVFGMLLIGSIYAKDIKTTSSYQAYNYENNGWAKQYATEWEERLEVLHNPNITNPIFEPMSLYGGYITMYDFYEEDNVAYWINEAAARYYNKESIHIK